jgi:hypothetical protein
MTTDKMLQCTICNEIVKNEVFWLKHSKSEKHIHGLKLLRESLTKKEKIEKSEKIQIPPEESHSHLISQKESEQVTINKTHQYEESIETTQNLQNPNKSSQNIKTKVLKILKDSDSEKDSSAFVPEVNFLDLFTHRDFSTNQIKYLK